MFVIKMKINFYDNASNIFDINSRISISRLGVSIFSRFVADLSSLHDIAP